MNERETRPDTQVAAEYLIDLGGLAAQLASIERAPRMPDGQNETDVEHSYFLGIAAAEIAARFFPHLDTGLISEMANVHDLPELITGDVWTFHYDDSQRAAKALQDASANEQLIATLPPHTSRILKRYSDQIEPEARLLRFIDKLLPAILNLINGDASTFLEDYEITHIDQLREKHADIAASLQAKFPDLPFIYDLLIYIQRLVEQRFYGPDHATIP